MDATETEIRAIVLQEVTRMLQDPEAECTVVLPTQGAERQTLTITIRGHAAPIHADDR